MPRTAFTRRLILASLFVAIASAPVYHSGALGAKNRVFLDAAESSEEFRAARAAFIASTQAAKDAGILPIQPHFDLRLHLMLNPMRSMAELQRTIALPIAECRIGCRSQLRAENVNISPGEIT